MGNARRPAEDIRKRTHTYALRAIKLFQALQESKDRAGWILGRQFLRSATAIGANLEEAQDAESRSDFVHKCKISLKEARESLYWLRLLSESDIVKAQRLDSLVLETEELIAILTSIIVKTKKSRPK